MDAREREHIQSLPGNAKCIDCGQHRPQWASIPFGVVFCLDCSGPHRGLGVHIDRVRSITMDSWTDDQIRRLQVGGNDKFAKYLRENVTKDDTDSNDYKGMRRNRIRATYTNPIIQHYRKILDAAAKGDTSPPPPVPPTISPTEDSQSAITIRQTVQSQPTVLWTTVFPQILRYQRSIVCATVLQPLYAVVCSSLFLATVWAFPDRRAQLLWYFLGKVVLFLVGFVVVAMVRSRRSVDHRNRPVAFKSAQNLLIQRITCGRAKRKDGYDLFLPPPKTTTTTTTPNDTEDDDNDKDDKAPRKKMGLLFYPAALIDHTAYAPAMAKLSDAGILVCMASLEPTRLTVGTPTDEVTKSALKIMYDVLATTGDYGVSEWAVGGHAAGGRLAINLAAAMTPGVSKVVLWGVGGKAHDSASLRDSAVDVLVLNETEDGVVQSMSEATKKQFRDILPKEGGGSSSNGSRGCTTYSNLDGGNHAGFAHYDPNLRTMNGIRTITLDEQQQTAVERTAKLILG